MAQFNGLQPVIVRTRPAWPVTRLESALFPAFSELCEGAMIMNPLEDRLQEYLSQFDDEPVVAPSLKRSVPPEQLAYQGRIVPTNSINYRPILPRIT